jgi:glycosyltransferase involved in cell wall biosynthesis
LWSEGINLEKFNQQGERNTRNGTTFLFLGRLLWDKGIGEFIEAARNIKNKYNTTIFKILGFLDCENPTAISKWQLEAWISEGVIEYLGDTDYVKEVILESDCVVLPSVFREGIPRSLLEASSLGIPVIATDIPGCRDVVDDNVTGYLCSPKNHMDLEKKMELIVNASEEKRRTMGKAGRDRVSKLFDVNIIIGAYREVLKKTS